MDFMEELFGKRAQTPGWQREDHARHGAPAAQEAVRALRPWLGFIGRHRMLFRGLAAAAIVLGIAVSAGLLTFGLQILSVIGDAAANLLDGVWQEARR